MFFPFCWKYNFDNYSLGLQMSVFLTLIHGTCLPLCKNPDDAAHVLPSSDPAAHLLPNKIKDFTAFINLVDFCR